jgi:hypothetical protein
VPEYACFFELEKQVKRRRARVFFQHLLFISIKMDVYSFLLFDCVNLDTFAQLHRLNRFWNELALEYTKTHSFRLKIARHICDDGKINTRKLCALLDRSGKLRPSLSEMISLHFAPNSEYKRLKALPLTEASEIVAHSLVVFHGRALFLKELPDHPPADLRPYLHVRVSEADTVVRFFSGLLMFMEDRLLQLDMNTFFFILSSALIGTDHGDFQRKHMTGQAM